MSEIRNRVSKNVTTSRSPSHSAAHNNDEKNSRGSVENESSSQGNSHTSSPATHAEQEQQLNKLFIRES